MVRTSTIQAMKVVALSSFKFKELVFNEFEDISEVKLQRTVVEDKESESEDFNQFDIWADLSLIYEGVPPESYRVLNSMIMDWVDDNEEVLKKIINPKLNKFLNDKYSDIDSSELDENFDDFIWEDQVDYFPEIDEENKKINFSLELVIEVEDEEEDEEEEDA